MRESFAWSNGIAGAVVGARTIRTVPELIAFARENLHNLDENELRRLGAIVYFVALRDYGQTNGAVLPQVEKALDSFYPVLPEPLPDRAFQAGMNMVRDQLFERRGDPYEQLVARALSLALSVRSDVSVDGAAFLPP